MKERGGERPVKECQQNKLERNENKREIERKKEHGKRKEKERRTRKRKARQKRRRRELGKRGGENEEKKLEGGGKTEGRK